MSWVDDLLAVQARGESAVAVAVASTRGSVPRDAGTRMVVTQDAVLGTIGGGHLELKAIGIARDMLESGAAVSLSRFPLGASLGQCCGGLVNLLFEPVAPDAPWVRALAAAPGRGLVVTALRGDGKWLVHLDAGHAEVAPGLIGAGDSQYLVECVDRAHFPLTLFGAGHVGRALAGILAGLDANLRWVDSREDEFPADMPPGVTRIVADNPADEVALSPPGSWFLVMTHRHSLDEDICREILRRGDAAYVGLIGSLTKRRQFERRLAARGIGAAALAAMHCPIGTPGLASKEPMAIAVSVAADLIRRREALAGAARRRLAL